MSVPATSNLTGMLEASDGLTGAMFRVSRASPSFCLVFSPMLFDQFELNGKVDGKEVKGTFWLPIPSRFNLVGGAAGILEREKGKPETMMYLDRENTGQKEKGEIWIRPTEQIGAAFLPPGVSPGSYRRIAQVNEAGSDDVRPHYVTVWDSYEVISPGMPAAYSFDRARFGLWIYSLVVAGRIPAVSPALIKRRIGRLNVHKNRVEALPLPDDVRKARTATATAAIKRAESAQAAA